VARGIDMTGRAETALGDEYMNGKRVITSAGVAVIGAMMTASLAPAQVVMAAPILTVPCQVAALAAAIVTANSGSGAVPTVLRLAPRCVYHLTAELPIVSEPLTIMGNGATLERSLATGTPAFTILETDAGALTVCMLNFRNGNGAIAVRGGATLTVNGGTFTGNTAADGGAIYDFSGAGGPVVNGATFTANSATDSGGAIYDNNGKGGVQVTDSVFTENTAVNSGGAIYDFSASEEDVTGSVFHGNSAEFGGALHLDPNGFAKLSDDVVDGNSATSDGGGIVDYFGIEMSNSRISDNHAAGRGGGLFTALSVDVTVTGTAVRGNSAADGGGVYNSSSGTGTIALTNVTVTGNRATGQGGGVYNHGLVAATGSSITRNVAAAGGGGIYDDNAAAAVTLASSPILHNKPDNCEPLASITGCTG
jgi:Chlamydia polymorphic membrane protein (Chlamydia_PMP) repeat